MATGLTLGLRRAMAQRGGALALVDDVVRLTWADLGDRIARLAGALRNAGLRHGDRVALLAMNGHHSVETYFAALWAGGIVVPFNHRLAEEELAAQFADAAPTMLVVDAALAAMGARLTERQPAAMTLFVGSGAVPTGMHSYEAAIATAPPSPDAERGGDDVACLFYTGGTTGAAKGVMLTHANLLANSVNFIAGTRVDDTIVHLHCGPLFHVAAGVRLFSVTLLGGRHVMLPRFAAREVLETIARERITLATFVPTMLRALLDEPASEAFDLSSLRTITYGAAPMPEAMLRAVMAWLPDVRFVQSYGMTETSPIITILQARDHDAAAERRLLRSAGRAALLAEVAVVDPDDQTLPPGERGEIVARGPMVMKGYWNRPDATAQALRGGWMHTGDVGFLDLDGYLYVVDRLKDVIISGGENVYSQEVENAISAHPAVAQCAVFGRPDERWGEAVHAVVVPHAGAALDPDDVRAHCKTLIAGFKCPRTVEIRRAPLPLSGANKVLKTELRAELLAREPA